MEENLKKEDFTTDILKLIAPGTALREGLENILKAKTGALIIIGDSKEVLDIVDGGFNINEEYTSSRLYELAKMDGAIVISEDLKRILYANAQIIPSSSIPTKETGTRHRTAERTAKQTGKLVISISQRRNIITIFKGNFRYTIEDTSKVITKANQALQILEKYKKVFDNKLSILNEYEFNDIVTLDNVINCIQRAEMVMKVVEEVKKGEVSVDEALLAIKKKPFEDIGYAKVDLHREVRQGAAEVIYGAGKTTEQMIGIIGTMKSNGVEHILITRLDEKSAEEIAEEHNVAYHKLARAAVIGDMPKPDGIGKIVVATGGTSDIPVAEEAALTAEIHGNEVVRLYDVGVAGIHRLLAHMDDIMNATVIIAIAGMEGALASVVGGLADCPVIAVPTSVGYGTSFGGISALLSMLNSCASGASVVNIDNGFGAGYLAGMINHVSIPDKE